MGHFHKYPGVPKGALAQFLSAREHVGTVGAAVNEAMRVRAGETPKKMAARLGHPGAMQELVLANRHLGISPIGKERGSGRQLYTFTSPAYGGKYRAGVRLVVPQSWLSRGGTVAGRSSGQVGFLNGIYLGGDCSGATDFCLPGQGDCVNGVCTMPGGGGSGGWNGTDPPGPGDDYVDPGKGGGGGGPGPGTGGGGTPCDIGLDCGQGEVCGIPEHKCRKANPGEIATGGVRNCADANVITDVQTAMGMGDQADGVWGCLSLQYFNKLGQPYQQLAQGCDGPTPALYCPNPYVPNGSCVNGACVPPAAPPPPKQCPAGQHLVGSDCVLDTPPPSEATNWWLYGILGTAVGAAVIGGVWYAGKKKSGRAHNPVGRYSLAELRRLRTKSVSQSGDLKIERGGVRVWLERTGVADGEPYDNKVTVEKYALGRWVTVDEYQAR